MHRLSQSVLEYVRKHDLLHAGDRVGVAVSGGADSVALIRVVLELRSELGVVVSTVHFNHHLRGEESDEDQRFVQQLAARENVPFILDGADVRAHAADKKLSVETAARELRYGFFRRLLFSGELDKIATAHSLDDQAETVLLKLARGTGTRGLAGIYPKISFHTSKVTDQPTSHMPLRSAFTPVILRPFLSIGRGQVEEYLREIAQGWREDTTNRDLRHARNRIRHEILPRLHDLVNPRIRETLAEVAEIARSEETYWEELSISLLSQVWKEHKEGGSLDGLFLRTQPIAIQRRLVRRAAETLGLNLEFQHVEEILALDREGARAALPKNWAAMLEKGRIHFAPLMPMLAASYEYNLKVPSRIAVPEVGVIVEATLVSTSEHDPGALLDGSLVSKNLTLRNWRRGERFLAAHSKAPKKIKELLQGKHITGEMKAAWPVIACGEDVIWVRDLGIRTNSQAKNGCGVLIRVTPL